MEAIADAEWLRSVFPEEVWLLIGEKIAHIHDHLRLRDSSDYFLTLLKSQLDHSMFSQVAKILHVQLKRYHEDVDTVIKKCRMVSRHWAECIDAAEENFPTSYLHPFRNLIEDCDTRYFRLSMQFFSGGDSIADFLQYFTQTHAGTKRNPFLCRSVHIGYGRYPAEAGNLIEHCLQLFREYGQHIWHCVIYLKETDLDALAQNKKWQEMLELLPNLRTLNMSTPSTGLQETTLNNLELYMKTHGLPTLKHLKFLQLYSIPTSLAKALMRANPQIKMLHSCSINHSVVFQERLPLLELFSTVLRSGDLFRVLSSSSLIWPLKQMSLQIYHGVSIKDLFELLGNRWSATLTELKLNFYSSREPLDVTPLQLPNLQKFSLESACYTPLDFLLPTKSSLKTLSLIVNWGCMQIPQEQVQSAIEAEKTVKFYGFCDNVLESNIWSLFPNLRSVDYLEKVIGIQARPQVYRRFDWMLKQTESTQN